jgi:hypothetical protein
MINSRRFARLLNRWIEDSCIVIGPFGRMPGDGTGFAHQLIEISKAGKGRQSQDAVNSYVTI